MARIAGINIPVNKHVGIALTHIFGIGRSSAKIACQVAGVDPSTPVRDLERTGGRQAQGHRRQVHHRKAICAGRPR